MIVTSIQVQSIVPGFEEKSLAVIGFETNDLDVFKVHVVAEMVDMACKPFPIELMTSPDYTFSILKHIVYNVRTFSSKGLGCFRYGETEWKLPLG